MAHEVFISHAVEDKQVADRVRRALEDEGVRCWITPRDIPPGRDYEESIVEAIGSSRVLLLVLSAHSNSSPHVKREVQHAFAEGSPTRVIPFRIEPVAFSKSLSYYLGSVQWIDASAPPLGDHLGRLVRHVRSELSLPAGATGSGVSETEGAEPAFVPRQPDAAPRSRAVWWAAGVAAALLLVAVVGFLALSPRENGGGNVDDLNVNATPATPTPTPHRATPMPAPTATPTPGPTRQPVRNLNLRLPANLRQSNIRRTP